MHPIIPLGILGCDEKACIQLFPWEFWDAMKKHASNYSLEKCIYMFNYSVMVAFFTLRYILFDFSNKFKNFPFH